MQVLTLSFFLIMFIPAIPQESKATFYCDYGSHALKYCPDSNSDEAIKECSVNNIAESHGNDSLRCDLRCETKSTMWDMICAHWDVPLLCKDKKDPLDLITESKLKDVLVLGGCLHIMVGQGEFPDTKETSSMKCLAKDNSTDSEHSLKTTCDITCNNAELNAMLTASKIPDNQVTGFYQFWMFFMCLVVSWIGMAVVVSVGDAICFEMLGDKHHLYGNQRLWGAVGWGCVSLVSGVLVDEFSKGKTYKDYSVLFYMMLVLILMDMLVSKKLKYNQTKLSSNILKVKNGNNSFS